MVQKQVSLNIANFTTFGDLLRYLRERAHLSQRELAAEVGYHYSYISYLENNLRVPDEASLLGRFVPALGLEDESEAIARLVELASDKRKKSLIPTHKTEPAVSVRSCVRLPPSLTSMIGRDREVNLLNEMLTRVDVRLITIVGPPGVGKTRLALHIAEQAEKMFGDGAIFVNLTPISQAELVPTAMAVALGDGKINGGNLQAGLREKNLLIVMDNFEQVVDAAQLLPPILGDAPGVKIIATSREALRVRGEHEFPLAPLPIQDHSFLESPAVQLFIERARAIQPDFKGDEETASRVAEICRHLDGLPLAIELAAARVRTLSLSSMLEQFGRRFEWLTRGGRDLPLWRQTLWGAINWSYALLSGQERALLNRLSVFADGWTLEAAEAVCSEDTLCARSDIFSLLMQLIDKSLVVEINDDRYGFLETLREFAYERLKESGDTERTRQLHCEYYLKFAQAIQPHLLQGGEQAKWLNQMAHDHNNLRAALTWATANAARATTAMELYLAVQRFWFLRGNFTEACRWLDQILVLDPAPTAVRAKLLRSASDFASAQGDFARASAFEEEGLKISQLLEDEAGIHLSMDGMAMLAGMQGDYARAAQLLEQVLVYRRQTNDMPRLSVTLNNLAIAARRLGNLERAKQLLLEAITVTRSAGNSHSLSHALSNLAEVHADFKEYAEAVRLERESILIRQALGNLKGLAFSLDSLAMSIDQLGHHILAAQLESASEKIRIQLGLAVAPATRKEKEDFIARLRAGLGDAEFEAAWSSGQAMTIDQAVTLAMKDSFPCD